MKNSIHHYYVYIVTNISKNVLYVGVANSLVRRINEHFTGQIEGFTQKYNCKYLVYYEYYDDINMAISREKQIKKWGKAKKIKHIEKLNPEWKFLNDALDGIERMYQ
ncbi:MAG: GIY-YIG nuclease family protein [Bacteroidetes bacterium]|nr:MAG: GIY-YIG nuclease family protein [Bacteroidota bacterium]